MRRFADYIGNFVYGAIDGTVTTFAVVAASFGAGLDSGLVIILGVANLLGDGFSMGSSAYLATKSEKDLAKHRRKKRLFKSWRKYQDLDANPMLEGVVTFISFVLVGFITIAAYVVDMMFGLGMSKTTLFLMSGCLTIATFIGVGVLRARIVHKNPFLEAVETLMLGIVAAILAYLSGDFLSRIFGI